MEINTPRKYSIYNFEGLTQKKIEVCFGTQQKNATYIIHRAYVAQSTERRQGTRGTKTKAEVRGGGKKPWQQKGTGRARAGSSRSPLWRGGGVIFGPKNQKYKKKINKKEKKLALQACLYNRSSNIIVTSNLTNNFSIPCTQSVIQILTNYKINTKEKILIITKEKHRNLYLSVRNIPNIEILLAHNLNLTSLLLARTILVTLDSIPIITKVYND